MHGRGHKQARAHLRFMHRRRGRRGLAGGSLVPITLYPAAVLSMPKLRGSGTWLLLVALSRRPVPRDPRSGEPTGLRGGAWEDGVAEWGPSRRAHGRSCRPPTTRSGPGAIRSRRGGSPRWRQSRDRFARGASIAEGHRCPLVSRIEVDVNQHGPRVASRQLDVDLLPWHIPVEEESGYEAGPRSGPDFGLKASVREGECGCEGTG